ncbi:glycosyltransferase family 4 protein [Dothidotthia symphoricarpi CBS 119687]|uniref:Glycosyltransferase family 4 protein n=1 Tax=Dothidotthia symphoricarpi CBS 119687 TaxID=1392245 RepID=A0A6A6AA58_9PLEO|nr:glycosyltransferase family 4 protein [Dothidotthia symphoricarpi CBS 119687]KAF2128446.1 glycosyltransferase family 4 protein [Dothidotthia symphoricarpi CBS 119687]
MYLGVAIFERFPGTYDVAIAVHDGTYSVDYSVISLNPPRNDSRMPTPSHSGTATPVDPGTVTPISAEFLPTAISDLIVEKIKSYQAQHLFKFIGAGLTEQLVALSHGLPARLWSEVDIVPLVLGPTQNITDEEADSMARKAVLFFGPNQQPRLMVGSRNQVKVDCDKIAQITDTESLKNSVHVNTWNAMMVYAESLKKNNTTIAFFNSTPQGGGVALMRHALIRLLRLIGVNCRWYVPKPKPEVFRITKNNHNILQGVAEPDLRLDDKSIRVLDNWCEQNAERYWNAPNCPLAPRSEGGADVIVVDDPQMPSLVKIAKRNDPERPVVFRSHIQVRADLANQADTPTAEVWNWVWDNVKDCDVFVSHPVREFVPGNVTSEKVGYLPATTDWLDGLNKKLAHFDTEYYMHQFRAECFKMGMATLQPNRPYIVQIARFDPAKGIPDVLASYAELRREYMKDTNIESIPQLVIAGHGAIDDPDATSIYNETTTAIKNTYPEFIDDIVVMRLGPSDQLLNVLMANAHVALQLSTREGFEVKVSEALHMGIPIIATRRGGIPLQVADGKSGYLVDAGDYKMVAYWLHHLFTDSVDHRNMSHYAKHHVSDEVSTVGNALAWLYLADTLAKGEKVEPDSKWLNDMAREKAGFPYLSDETRLPRNKDLSLPH